jgi:hypothetical protein
VARSVDAVTKRVKNDSIARSARRMEEAFEN